MRGNILGAVTRGFPWKGHFSEVVHQLSLHMLAWDLLRKRTEGSGLSFIPLLLKCKYAPELAAFRKLISPEEWGWSHSRRQSGDPQDAFAPLLLSPSLFILQGSFALQASSVTVCMEGVFCTAPTAGFSSASVILILPFCYLGLLDFLNRAVCQGEDKVD